MPAEVDLSGVMRRAHFAFRQRDSQWVGGHTNYEARVHNGLELWPARVQKQEPVQRAAQPFRARLTSLRRGTWLVEGGVNDTTERADDGALFISHGVVRERLENTEAGVEQSFHFANEPGQNGELVVQVAVQGLGFVGQTSEGLHFNDSSGAGVRYGRATWVDATERRTPLTTTFRNGSIFINVPGEVLRDSVYPAVLDPTISPEFGIDQPVIVPAEENQLDPDSAFGAGVHLVVWRDQRFLAGLSERAGYLFGTRVTPAGEVLDPTGIAIITQSIVSSPSIASDGTGFMVAVAGDTMGPIRTVRLDAQGKVLDATPHATGVSGIYPSLASNGSGYLLGFIGNLTSRPPTVAVLSSDGTATGSTSVGTEATHISLAPGAQDYLVAYSQWAPAQAGSPPSAHAVRVRPNGQMVSGSRVTLPNGGATSQTKYQTAVASDGTNFLVAYLGGVSQHNAYYAHFDGNFALTASAMWRDGNFVEVDATYNGSEYLVGYHHLLSPPRIGVARFPAGGNTSKDVNFFAEGTGVAVSVGGGSELIAYASTSGDVEATRLSSTLTALDVPALKLSRAAHREEFPAAAYNGQDYLVVWQDKRANDATRMVDLYGARITPEGVVRDSAGFAISTADFNQTAPVVASNGSNFFVAWQDTRSGANGTGTDIFGTAISADGVVATPAGLPINTDGSEQTLPSIASDGSNYFVVWQGANGIRGLRLSSSGAALDSAPLVITSSIFIEPTVGYNGTNYLVAWANETSRSIHGARVTPQGSILDSSARLLASPSTTDSFRRPRMASNGSEWLLTCESSPGGATLARRLASDGSVLGSIPSIGSFGSGIHNSLAWNGRSYWSVWQKQTSIGVYDIAARRVSGTGTLIDSADIAVSNAAETEQDPSVAAGPAGQVLVAYHRINPNQPYGSYRVHARIITDDPASGGSTSTGGASSTGGSSATGGTTSSGGVPSSGGATSTGGTSTQGGRANGGAGGAITAGGTAGAGARGGTAGAANGGSNANAGGNVSAGGTSNTGGNVGTSGGSNGTNSGGTGAGGTNSGGSSAANGGALANGDGGAAAQAGSTSNGGNSSAGRTGSGGSSGRAATGGSAGTAAQAGVNNEGNGNENDGCGCRVGRESSNQSTALGLVGVALAALRRRRRSTPS